MTESLSDRIEQLKKELKDNAILNWAQIDGIIRLIVFMDKEFIKQIKEKVEDKSDGNCWASLEVVEIIDKLAGDKLIDSPQDSPKNMLSSSADADVCENCGKLEDKHSNIHKYCNLECDDYMQFKPKDDVCDNCSKRNHPALFYDLFNNKKWCMKFKPKDDVCDKCNEYCLCNKHWNEAQGDKLIDSPQSPESVTRLREATDVVNPEDADVRTCKKCQRWTCSSYHKKNCEGDFYYCNCGLSPMELDKFKPKEVKK